MWIIRSAVFSLPAYGWIKIMKDNGFKIFGIDIKFWDIPNYIDNYAIVPVANKKNEKIFLNKINDIIKNIKPAWIISGPENEIELLSKNEEIFTTEGVKIFHPPYNTVKTITDKLKAYNYFKNKIPLPLTMEAGKSKELNMKLPFVIKPKKGRGSKGFFLISNAFEKELYLKLVSSKEYIIQEYLDGEEFSVDALFDMEGVLLNAVIRKRVEVDSGIAIVTQTIKIQELFDIIETISNMLHFRGMVNFQFIKSGEIFYLTDINPRFGGASIISWHASSSFRENLINLLKGKYRDLKRNVFDYDEIKLFRFYMDITVKC